MTMVWDIVKAVFTRLVFSGHIILAVWWVVQVTEVQQLWYLASFVGALFVETFVSIFYRKGKEYKWFSPSIFCHLAAIIPCAWILELHLLDERRSNTTAAGAAEEGEDLVISQKRWTDLIEQTTLLLMILGRWLLPNDYLTRESLSQLLLVNLAMAADIIEFFDILKLDFVMDSKPLALTILSLWSWSLMQFPFNLTATFQSEEMQRPKSNQVLPENDDLAKQYRSYEERHFKPRASMSSYDFKQMIAAKRASRSLTHDFPTNNYRRYSCQPITEVDSSSYQNASHPVTRNSVPRGSIVNLNDVARDRLKELGRNFQGEKPSENARRLSVSSRRLSVNPSNDLAASYLPGAIPPQAVPAIEEEAAVRKPSHVTTIDITEVNSASAQKSRLTGDLVMSFMSLFMEDCPFLTVRLFMIAYYHAFEYMIIFLTVKNALVLTLQVYRLCSLYCVCHDHKENDFSPENEVDQQSRLANVQIAVTHEEPTEDAAANGRKKRGWRQATRNIRSPMFFTRTFSRDG